MKLIILCVKIFIFLVAIICCPDYGFKVDSIKIKVIVMRENRKVNAQAVAALAQVSQTTVSRVFAHNPHVSDAVRRQVMTAAEKLQYAPRKSAAANTFILALPSPLTYYYAAILDGVRAGIEHTGYVLEIADIHQLAAVSPARMAGIITVNDLTLLPDELRRRLVAGKVPLLTINQEIDHIPSVSSDHAAGIAAAVTHCFEYGHKNIACVIFAGDGPLENLNFAKRERIRGYREAMKSCGLEYDRKMVFMTSEPRLVESVALALNRGASAIIMAEEGCGLQLQYALALLNRRVPEDVSVISYEAPAISSYLQPAQTGIDQDAFTLGRLAAQRMIAIIDHIDDAPLHLRLDNRFHQRDSVAAR